MLLNFHIISTSLINTIFSVDLFNATGIMMLFSVSAHVHGASICHASHSTCALPRRSFYVRLVFFFFLETRIVKEKSGTR